MENRKEIPQKLKIELPCDPATLLLGIQPEEMHPLGLTSFMIS